MKSTKIIFFICLLLVFTSCKKETQKTYSVDNTQVFQTILDSIYNQNKDAIGLMAHIEAPDKNISWSGAAGFSDKNNTKLEAGQPVLIASNTKTYVSAAILRLVEDGKLNLSDGIDTLLTKATNDVLVEDTYATSKITIQHLLSHTSGVFDYAGTEEYMNRIKAEPKHRYSRNEQIKMALSIGNPLSKPGDVFAYSDTNYLLLTEIIEQITNKPFYIAIRELINYNALKMNVTWFSTLEDKPEKVKPLAHQYFTSEGFDSYTIDHSFDLYGGGGIASTSKDLAVFLQSLFNNKILKKPETLELIYTKANPKLAMEGDYYLGLSSVDFGGVKGYGHGGFWGTAVNYFPELNASIAVVVLDRDQRVLRGSISVDLIKALKEHRK